MSIDALAFCFGGLLLFVALIGGGFELKELKVPRLTWLPRAIFGSIGLAFILLGIGMQQMANEKKQGTTVSSASEPPPEVRPEPVAPIPEKHATQQTGPELATGFAGITGQALVAWSVGSGPYVARLQLNGERGVADVEFQTDTGAITVRQDLTLVPNSVGWLYVGSNPRNAAAAQALAVDEYSPDSFRLMQQSDGSWTIRDTCDQQGECSPVRVEPL